VIGAPLAAYQVDAAVGSLTPSDIRERAFGGPAGLEFPSTPQPGEPLPTAHRRIEAAHLSPPWLVSIKADAQSPTVATGP
jgi:hypothetical protein